MQSGPPTAADIFQRWYEGAHELLPEDVEVWDAHTHTGQNDPDGFTNTAEVLLDSLDAAGHAGAVIMSSADGGGYGEANRRVLAEAAASAGRLIPFLRIDPHLEDVVAVVESGLDAGHRGVKLHPRSESFALTKRSVADVCRVAAERGAPVLVHAGRGIPPFGQAALDLVESMDGLRLILEVHPGNASCYGHRIPAGATRGSLRRILA